MDPKRLRKKKKKKEYVIMTERGKKPEGIYAIEKPKSRKQFFIKFFHSLFRPYGAILKKKAKLNSVIEDLDEEKDPVEQETSIIRDVVILRKIQKVVIEALNVCPDECISDLYDIYNVLKQDFPPVIDLERDFNKKEQEEEGEEEQEDKEPKKPKGPQRGKLKEYLAESIEKMTTDIVSGFEYLQQFSVNPTKPYKRDFVAEFKGMRTHYLLQTGENKDVQEDEGNGEEEEQVGLKTDGEIYGTKKGILKKEERHSSENRIKSRNNSKQASVVEEEEDEDEINEENDVGNAVDEKFDEFQKSMEDEKKIEINENDINLDGEDEDQDEKLENEKSKEDIDHEFEEALKKRQEMNNEEDDNYDFDDDEFNYEKSQKEETLVDSNMKEEEKSKSKHSEESTARELVIVEGFKKIDESQMGYNEAEVKHQCEEYFKKLSSLFTDSFKSNWEEISNSIEKCDKEIFITFRDKDNGDLKGLAILAINQSEAEILHISTLGKKDFLNACSMVCLYTKNNSVIQDLIVGVNHREIEIDGKMKIKMDPFFKVKLKEIGFKWVKIENRGGRRFTMFKHKNGVNSNEASNQTLMRLSTGKIRVAKVFTEHLLVLSDVAPEVSNIIQAEGFFESTLGEFFAFKKYKEMSNKGQLNGWLEGKLKSELSKKFKDDNIIDEVEYKEVDLEEDAENIQADFCQMQLGGKIEILPNFLAEKTRAYSFHRELDIKFARPAIHNIQNIEYEYLRISFNKKTMRMRNESLGANIYVAPTAEERYLYFFINFDDEEKLDDINIISEFRSLTREVFKVLEPVNDSDKEDLWIPNFNFLAHCEDMSQEIGSMTDMPQVFSMIRMELRGSHEGEIMKRNPTESSVIFQGKFIFGINDTKLDESTGLPLFSCLVKESQFTKS